MNQELTWREKDELSLAFPNIAVKALFRDVMFDVI